jgi:hypothetical protein
MLLTPGFAVSLVPQHYPANASREFRESHSRSRISSRIVGIETCC